MLSWSALGLLAGLVAVFLRKHLNVKLEWAEDAERRLGLPVYATVPYSPKEVDLDSKDGNAQHGGRRLLAEEDPQDIAIESLRSLRASLHFAMMEAKRNLVVITGSTPSVGKSFVSANLAKLVADSKRKVLLVDADLRKGRVNKMLGLDRSPGLSELIAGQATMEQALRQIGTDPFWVITTGKLPPNPAELLASQQFIELVEQACKQFDLVIVDTPPVMNLADGVLVAKSAGAVFVTVRGGQSTVPDVQDCIQRFAKNGIKVDGLIFNGMRMRIGSYVHPTYYHYRYRYSRYGSGKT
jgi:tyrosine-protein kinase Etk/Wzc